MQEPPPLAGGIEPQALLGSILDGRYELTAHLATGGMGAVFRARHVHLRKDVAVKVLRPELSASPELVERFRREAEIASALSHDNIVHVTDFGRDERGLLYLAMELLAGESLFDRLRREGRLPPAEALPILWQVCAGLEAAHALGVVHRDLKPENVYLARTASGRVVTKLLDFGIAKIAGPLSGSATQAGVVVGTPEYLAPEQAAGGAVDGRADLYAVGLIGWRMLAGRHPFQARDPRELLMMQATQPVPPLEELRPELAAWPGLLATVARACAKDPEARHPSAAALRDDVAAALGPAFVAPPGATPVPPSPRPDDGFELLSPAPVPGERDRRRRPTRAAGSPEGWLSTGHVARSAQSLAQRVAARLRAHPRRVGGGAAVLAAGLLLVVAAAWVRERPVREARSLLAAGRPAEARAAAEGGLQGRPRDPRLLLLRGRALHRLPGQAAEGIDAYRDAREAGPLDAEALDDLTRDLARERSLADRAARLLRDVGDPAVPALLAAARDGEAAGIQRLRALALLRDLGAEERVDRADAYGALLADADCDVRRAAARRLGELGDPAALERLREAAGNRGAKRGPFGLLGRSPACGAAEAAEAVRRVEAAR